MRLKETLSKVNPSKLIDILVSLYEQNKDLQKYLDIMFAGLDEDPKKIVSLIKKEIASLKRSTRYVDYYESSALADRLNQLRLRIIDDVCLKSSKHAWELMLEFLDLHEKTFDRVDDSNVSYKDRKELAADLKPIYTAATEDDALLALESLESKWGQKYPQISKSWLKHWANLVGFLQYPKTIRRMIYTTNAIESVNSGLRKITNNKRIFPNDESVFKSFYLTLNYMTSKWTMPIQNWGEALSHFMIKFEGRI